MNQWIVIHGNKAELVSGDDIDKAARKYVGKQSVGSIRDGIEFQVIPVVTSGVRYSAIYSPSTDYELILERHEKRRIYIDP